ncbi:MAG: L-glyceraldehyde 3-phosphate reductase [Porphyromonadaceae bacterium]|nr:L-glyceraldehyde 3-phosphate reductase [Porphyromonadaceae bacterium]
MKYTPSPNRYTDTVGYNYCGKSGLQLPRISLGLWHNFGDVNDQNEARDMLRTAFDNGITHFDLANNYGTPFGSAEKNFGKFMKEDFVAFRDELIISTKAGHLMWEGPYGDWGSRKYLIASLDQSLKRMGLDYVDIFYSHRYDPNTPIEETMGALSDMVKQGKALYVGISKYPPAKAREAFRILRENGTPCLIYQDRYSLLQRGVELDLFPLVEEKGLGFIGFSPLSQGLLSDKYLKGIPENSRAGQDFGFLMKDQVTPEIISKVTKLNDFAKKRKQTLAQMALAWCLNDKRVTSVIVGTSSVKQLKDNIKALENTSFTDEELWLIGEAAGSM